MVENKKANFIEIDYSYVCRNYNIIFFLGELPFWSDMSIFWKAGAGAGVDLFLRYASCHKYRA